MVYSDATGRVARLSEEGQRGWRVWHEHNCQSCHQVFGFGGFLGPDLTNVASRLLPGSEEGAAEELARRLETVLTSGSERMPGFWLDPEQRLALSTFLVELDRTGTGQAKVAGERAPREIFEDLVARIPLGEGRLGDLEAQGRELMIQHGCIDCHLPNGRSVFRAADLTALHSRVDTTRMAEILAEGIPAKGMPALRLSSSEAQAVEAFLARLESVGGTLRSGFESAERSSSGSLLELPWFEYP